jgi:hypothetical protein
MKGNSTVEGESEIQQQLNVLGDTTVRGYAEVERDMKIHGRLTLLHTSARINMFHMLQAIDPGVPLASTVNIIEYPLSIPGGPYLDFIPAPEGIEKGTMMTLTYSPLIGDRINLSAPPIEVINCRADGDCSPETENISLKQASQRYEMFPGNTLTLVNSYSNIWYEISRSSAQIEVFGIETEPRYVAVGSSEYVSIDCVRCSQCAECPDCDEKAIMLVTSVDFLESENLELIHEVTREYPAGPGESFEMYTAVVRNFGSVPERFKVKARCMIP